MSNRSLIYDIIMCWMMKSEALLCAFCQVFIFVNLVVFFNPIILIVNYHVKVTVCLIQLILNLR